MGIQKTKEGTTFCICSKRPFFVNQKTRRSWSSRYSKPSKSNKDGKEGTERPQYDGKERRGRSFRMAKIGPPFEFWKIWFGYEHHRTVNYTIIHVHFILMLFINYITSIIGETKDEIFVKRFCYRIYRSIV